MSCRYKDVKIVNKEFLTADFKSQNKVFCEHPTSGYSSQADQRFSDKG